MAQKWCGHFDSTPEDERLLLAEDWARFIRAFVSDGIRNGGTCLQVTAGSGMSVRVDTGIASIQGYIIQLFEDHTGRYTDVPVQAANPSLPRIDRLVLRLDRTIACREIIPMTIIGTAASSPVPPPLLRNENFYDLSLARIRVNAGVTQITGTNITDERFDQDVCGLMHSVLGLDSSSWQNAFDSFMSQASSDFNAAQNSRTTTFNTSQTSRDTAFNTAQTGRQSTWDTWFGGVQTDMALAAGFDFWNAARNPANYYITEYPANGSIVTTIRRTANNLLVAVGTTTYPANGSVVYEEVVYQSNGSSIQRRTRETTTYPGGTIRKEVVTF